MAAERPNHWVDGVEMASRLDDSGAKAEIVAAHNYVWDSVGLAWVRETQPGGTGGGGGGPATIADGADVAQGTTTDTSAANTVVGILKAIKAAVQGTLTVATHAVTQSGVWTVARSWTLSSATDSVDVGNFPATQPVSIAAAIDVSDRVGRLLGHITDDTASLLAVTTTAATGVAATLTLPAAGVGLFHYIDYFELSLYATAARTGGATPVIVTTTNLPGSPAWDFETGQAIGTMIRQQIQLPTPLKSSVANTATTFVAPIATTGIWRLTAFYHTAT